VDLGQWVYEARILEGRPATTRADLDLAHELRGAVVVCVEAAMAGMPLPAGAVATLNRVARIPTLSPQLVEPGRGLRWVSGTPVAGALAAVARDAVELLASDAGPRLRTCAAAGCGLVFYDASRPGTRRWCSMATCGNRAKLRTHRARHEAGPGGNDGAGTQRPGASASKPQRRRRTTKRRP
jgi:predicted RNA-binding Zn ribbon-like protein